MERNPKFIQYHFYLITQVNLIIIIRSISTIFSTNLFACLEGGELVDSIFVSISPFYIDEVVLVGGIRTKTKCQD